MVPTPLQELFYRFKRNGIFMVCWAPKAPSISINLSFALSCLGTQHPTGTKGPILENCHSIWLVVYLPLWKICSSVGMMKFPIHVPNHQPGIFGHQYHVLPTVADLAAGLRPRNNITRKMAETKMTWGADRRNLWSKEIFTKDHQGLLVKV